MLATRLRVDELSDCTGLLGELALLLSVARSVGGGRESREASSRSRFSSTWAFTGFLLEVVAKRPLLLSLLPLLLPFRDLPAMVKSCTVVRERYQGGRR